MSGRNEHRRDAVFLAAKEVFTGVGYDAASMDVIAARAGITKRTLYNHFASKDVLFTQTVQIATKLFVAALPTPDADGDVEEEIALYLGRFTELTTWENTVGLQRVVLAETRRFPELARAMYGEALGTAKSTLAAFLAAAAKNGAALAGSPDEAAGWLLAVASSEPRFETLFGLRAAGAHPPAERTGPNIDLAAIKRVVSLVVTPAVNARPVGKTQTPRLAKRRKDA